MRFDSQIKFPTTTKPAIRTGITSIGLLDALATGTFEMFFGAITNSFVRSITALLNTFGMGKRGHNNIYLPRSFHRLESKHLPSHVRFLGMHRRLLHMK